MKYPGFVGASYASRSVNAAADQTMNLYPEVVESESGKSKIVLYGTPGLALFCTLPTSPVRGLFANGSLNYTSTVRLFAVAGSKLYEVFVDGTYSELGDVGDDAQHSIVQMIPNGNQLMVVSAGQVYVDNGGGPAPVTYSGPSGIVNTAGTAVTWVSGDKFEAGMVAAPIIINFISYTVFSFTDDEHIALTATAGTQTGSAYSTSADYVIARMGGFLDGYFIAQVPLSKQFNISAINNGLSWDPLDFGLKASYPDNILAILVDHSELWLFGEQTTEVFYNSGSADFPLVPNQGAFIHQGISAPDSACSLANGVAWIGGDGRGSAVAWYAQGFQPKRISTHAVESAWSSYAISWDAVGYAYEEHGHQFWVLRFGAAGKTWVYDATIDMWHERGYWSGSANVAQLACCHAFGFGEHIVGDATSGRLYYQRLTAYTDNSTAIHRVRTAPHVSDEDKWLFFSRFRLDMQNTGAIAPTLAWSIDGGTTFGTDLATTSSTGGGALAMYEWRRLGRSRDRVFRISVSTAFKVAMIDAYLELTVGTG